ncbi:reverse transcriptase domain-containing protein, partial [Tanacetum coccineum]
IMPPRMTTRSAGQPAAATRGGVTGGQVGGQGREESKSDAANDYIQGDVGNVIKNNDHKGCTDKKFLACNLKEYDGRGVQRNGRDQNGDAANDHIQGDVRNVIENNDYRVCTYKKFLACNPKEYDGKGGMSWDNFKVLMREEFCLSNKMQKLETELWNHAMVRAGHATYTDRFHEFAWLVPRLVTPENRRIEMYVYGLAP